LVPSETACLASYKTDGSLDLSGRDRTTLVVSSKDIPMRWERRIRRRLFPSGRICLVNRLTKV
jgi:hypothetical protein